MKDKELLSYWSKRNEECLKEARYSTWAFKGLIERFFTDLKGKKIIELGCGYGTILKHIENRGAMLYGVEICGGIAKKGKEMNPDIKLIHGDCRKVPFKDNSFDYVMSFGVIEHLKDWDRAMGEHFRICKPGGKVLVVVPNIFSPLYYVTFLYYLPRIIKYNLLVSLGKGFGKSEFRKAMGKYGKVKETKAFDFCSLLEGLTRKQYFGLAGFLERYFGFMGLMLYCIAEKEQENFINLLK